MAAIPVPSSSRLAGSGVGTGGVTLVKKIEPYTGTLICPGMGFRLNKPSLPVPENAPFEKLNAVPPPLLLKFMPRAFVWKFGKRLASTITGFGLQPPLGSMVNCKLNVSVGVKPERDVREMYPRMKLGPFLKFRPYLSVFATKVTPVKVKPFNVAVEPNAPLLKAPCVLPVNTIEFPLAYVDRLRKMKIATAATKRSRVCTTMLLIWPPQCCSLA